jgi:hypothetical protein
MAYEFAAASSQHLTTASAPVSSHPCTLSCWFYSNTLTNCALVTVETTSGNLTLMNIGANDNGTARANIYQNASGATFDTTASFSNQTWNHIACAFSSATSRTLYLNGGNSVTNTTSVTTSSLVRAAISGRYFSGSTSAFANGRIAEVGIWNAALTAAEIASLADGMTCDKVRPQSLVFYAPLVRNLQDVRGGRTITNNNTATVANHPRVYA